MKESKNPLDVSKVSKRYRTASILLLLVGLIYSAWIAFVIISVYFLGFGNKWALITMDDWILSAIALLAVFIFLEIIIILAFYNQKKKIEETKKPKPKYLKGKKLHVYTLPANSQGGIFSKTFVMIDNDNVLNLRYQMIPPEDLLKNKD